MQKADNETIKAVAMLSKIICSGDFAKIREIAAGNINKAVINKIPTAFAMKEIATANKHKNPRFIALTLTLDIFAKSSSITTNKNFLKNKAKNKINPNNTRNREITSCLPAKKISPNT